MTQLFYPIFNTIIGLLGLLIGFKIYQPFTKERTVIFLEKFGLYFKIAGTILLIIGITDIIRVI